MGGNGAGEMSATCYYFGTELYDTLKVQIGLLHTSYGGSAVEDWIDAETLGMAIVFIFIIIVVFLSQLLFTVW